MEMTFTTPTLDTALIRLVGKFTIEDIPSFKESISAALLERTRTMFIDFSNIKYIDSSAVGTLIILMNSAKNRNKEVIFFNVGWEIHNVLKIAYLDKFFTITTSAELKIKHPGIAF